MLDGVWCALAVIASVQSLRTPGALSPARRQALRDAAGVGGAVIVAYAMATGFESMLAALAVAAFAVLTPPSWKTTPASLQSALALAALASASADRAFGLEAGMSPGWTALGGLSAVAMVFALGYLRLRALEGLPERLLKRMACAAPASTMHFACAALCTVIAYTAGFEGGAVAVVIIGAMVALIGAYLAMALADRAYPVFIAALNGYAACSIVAAGVGLANGALVVTGVALVLGCVATCTSAAPSRVSSKK
ncbi:hypothetical protein AWB64_01840 [Caballeronia sordidicola]|uniref:Uncharacterized protein n=1 Tax=Caballeronia sordidicola TaxID=196367 RepID=A0A158FVT3_CABSO|nr:hypothetical protein [Caballeronia sordidicola]SAL23459.1 hypothetical protein AWB64_01840 [Caballeronia sordidicola]